MKRWKRPSTNEWRKPLLIFIGSLITIILIIPTIIVVPFTQTDGVEKKSVNTNTEAEATPVALQTSDSPFSVHVYRTQADDIENVPLENYVARVVASEMPADFELEALKAQALAARTYIVNHLMYQTEDSLPEGVPTEADVTDTVQYQVYKNEDELLSQWGSDFDWKMNKIKQAVVETKGEIITYEEQPITPAFFSTSNGYTEDSEKYWANELPYLRSVESPWDQKESPKFTDQKVLTSDQVEQALGIQLDSSDQSFVIERTESNRVKHIILGNQTFSGREVREALDLRSSDFEVEQKNDHLIFTTKGFGHGIGMSQYGANGMAKEGKNYKEIVTYYYQGTKIDEVTSTAPKLVVQN